MTKTNNTEKEATILHELFLPDGCCVKPVSKKHKVDFTESNKKNIETISRALLAAFYEGKEHHD